MDDSNARHGYRLTDFPAGGATYDPLPSIYDTRAGAGDRTTWKRAASRCIDWEISDTLTFRSISAWRNGETRGNIDFDNTPTRRSTSRPITPTRQFSQEFQLLFDAGRVQGVAGVYYMDAMAEGAFDTVLGNLGVSILSEGRVDTESYAAFADVSIDLMESLALSIGGRWTQDNKDARVLRQTYLGIRSPFFGNSSAVLFAPNTNYTNDATFEEFTPRVSLTWKPVDEISIYGSYSQGFKSGGFDMRGDASLTPSTVDGYDPEFVDTYEIGFHSGFMQGRVNISGAVFYSEYTDMQITRQEPTITGGIASYVDNAAEAEMYGAEWKAAYSSPITSPLISPSAILTASSGVSLKRGGGQSGVRSAAAGRPDQSGHHRVPIDLSGAAGFQNTPDLTGAFSLTYAANVAGGVLAITPSVSYRSDSQMFEFANPILDQDAYTLYNASVVWTSESERFRLGLHGLNLSDEEYRVGGYNFPGATFGNSIIGFYGPPQTFTASVEVRF